jgi:hypothetical protein
MSIPPPAAAAIASVMGRALLAAWSGVRVDLAKTAVWVQRLAIPMSVDLGETILFHDDTLSREGCMRWGLCDLEVP